MSDVFQQVILNFNAVVCAVTAVRLFHWQKNCQPTSLIHRVAVYLLMISCSAVTIRTLTGEYFVSDWSEAVINAALCFFCLTNPGILFRTEPKK